MSGFKQGDVLSYMPAGSRHCREGLAFVDEHGVARDTYWDTEGDSQSHVLTAQEVSAAILVFNVEDYIALDPYSAASAETWKTYHPDDRALITSQHGLQRALFIRNGAEPSLETQIDNAREALERAEEALRSARWAVEQRELDLDALQQESFELTPSTNGSGAGETARSLDHDPTGGT